MKIIEDEITFKSMFNKEGIPKRKFRVKDDVRLHDLDFVRSLEGITVGKDSGLIGLSNLLSLKGVILRSGSVLMDLTSLVSFGDVSIDKDINFYLTGIDPVKIPPKPSLREVVLLKQIPFDKLDNDLRDLDNNKGSHCFVELCNKLSNPKQDPREITYSKTCELLPSMIPYFFSNDEDLKKYLITL